MKKISFPVPPPSLADLRARFEAAITPRTKVIHVCHITNLTGQIFPVRDICRMARARGITTIVDGAHAYGHFPFALADLECDYYGTSLHKWLLAPVGTGFLYVRRPLIEGHWALTPAGERLAGRHPQVRGGRHAPGREPPRHCRSAGLPADDRHASARRRGCATCAGAGPDRLRGQPRIRILTSDDPAQAGAIGTVGIEGVDPAKLAAHLWDKRRIIVTPIKHAEFEGVRVTPNLYTTLDEVDTFAGGDGAIAAADGRPRSAAGRRSPPPIRCSAAGLRRILVALPLNAQFTARRISMRRTFLFGLMTAPWSWRHDDAPREPRAGSQTVKARAQRRLRSATAVSTGAHGNATVTIDPATGEVTWVDRRLQLPHRAHRVAHPRRAAGHGRPVVIDFAPQPIGVSGAVPARGLVDERSPPRPAQGIRSMDEIMFSIAAGTAYVNVHTQTNRRRRDPRPAVPGQGQRQPVQRHRALHAVPQ